MEKLRKKGPVNKSMCEWVHILNSNWKKNVKQKQNVLKEKSQTNFQMDKQWGQLNFIHL